MGVTQSYYSMLCDQKQENNIRTIHTKMGFNAICLAFSDPMPGLHKSRWCPHPNSLNNLMLNILVEKYGPKDTDHQQASLHAKLGSPSQNWPWRSLFSLPTVICPL